MEGVGAMTWIDSVGAGGSEGVHRMKTFTASPAECCFVTSSTGATESTLDGCALCDAE